MTKKEAGISYQKEQMRLLKLMEATEQKSTKAEREAIAKDAQEYEEKCVAFVRHIQDHIINEDKNIPKGAKVVCKFCNKTIDEIWAEIEEKWKWPE